MQHDINMNKKSILPLLRIPTDFYGFQLSKLSLTKRQTLYDVTYLECILLKKI